MKPDDYRGAKKANQYFTSRFRGRGGEYIESCESAILEKFIKESNPDIKVMADLGCGYGRAFKYVTKIRSLQKGFLIDSSSSMLELARDFLEKEQQLIELKLIVGDALDTDLESNSCDCLTAFHLLKHLEDPAGFFGEAKRVLKARGALIFESANKFSILGLLPCSSYLRSKREIKKQLKRLGFKVSSRGCQFLGETLFIKLGDSRLLKPLIVLDGFLAKVFPPFCTKIFFSATKSD